MRSDRMIGLENHTTEIEHARSGLPILVDRTLDILHGIITLVIRCTIVRKDEYRNFSQTSLRVKRGEIKHYTTHFIVEVVGRDAIFAEHIIPLDTKTDRLRIRKRYQALPYLRI